MNSNLGFTGQRWSDQLNQSKTLEKGTTIKYGLIDGTDILNWELHEDESNFTFSCDVSQLHKETLDLDIRGYESYKELLITGRAKNQYFQYLFGLPMNCYSDRVQADVHDVNTLRIIVPKSEERVYEGLKKKIVITESGDQPPRLVESTGLVGGPFDFPGTYVSTGGIVFGGVNLNYSQTLPSGALIQYGLMDGHDVISWNISEDEINIQIKCDMSNLNQSSLNLDIRGYESFKELVIAGHSGNNEYFRYIFQLPMICLADRVQADFTDNNTCLVITVPKSKQPINEGLKKKILISEFPNQPPVKLESMGFAGGPFAMPGSGVNVAQGTGSSVLMMGEQNKEINQLQQQPQTQQQAESR